MVTSMSLSAHLADVISWKWAGRNEYGASVRGEMYKIPFLFRVFFVDITESYRSKLTLSKRDRDIYKFLQDEDSKMFLSKKV